MLNKCSESDWKEYVAAMGKFKDLVTEAVHSLDMVCQRRLLNCMLTLTYPLCVRIIAPTPELSVRRPSLLCWEHRMEYARRYSFPCVSHSQISVSETRVSHPNLIRLSLCRDRAAFESATLCSCVPH